MRRLRDVRVRDFLERSGEAVLVEATDRYRTAGIRSFGKGIFERSAIFGSETKYTTLWRTRPGQLVFSKLFAWEGAIAVATQEHNGLLFSSEFPIFDIDDSQLLPEFAVYLAQWTGLHERLRASTTGVGNRRQWVNPERFLAVTVPLPELDYQHHIVSRLEAALSQLPSAVNRGRAVGLGLTESLLNYSFDGEREVPTADVMELTGRPTEVVAGKSYQVAGVYSFGRGMFRRGRIDASGTKYSTLFAVREGDLVLSRLKAFEGAIAVAGASVDGCFVSQEFPTFRVDRSVCSTRYLHYLCRWPAFWARLASGSKGVGSRRERVSAEAFLTTRIPMPSLVRQKEILCVLDRGVGELGTLAARREELLGALRPSLLNAAFSGQL